MRYAKLINNYPSYAPRRMRISSVWVYNPTDAQLLAEGYLPVIETDAPTTDDEHYAIPSWKEENGRIVQEWSVEEIPDEATESDYIDALQDLGVEVE